MIAFYTPECFLGLSAVRLDHAFGLVHGLAQLLSHLCVRKRVLLGWEFTESILDCQKLFLTQRSITPSSRRSSCLSHASAWSLTPTMRERQCRICCFDSSFAAFQPQPENAVEALSRDLTSHSPCTDTMVLRGGDSPASLAFFTIPTCVSMAFAKLNRSLTSRAISFLLSSSSSGSLSAGVNVLLTS